MYLVVGGGGYGIGERNLEGREFAGGRIMC